MNTNATDGNHDLSDMCVLFVEDHPTVRESLQCVFSAAGLQHVEAAATCAETLRAVEQQPVDVVLLDVVLPDGNGLDALEGIKSIDPNIPVLMHSYQDSPSLLARSYELGAGGYVVKGADINYLIDAVRATARGKSVWTAQQMERIREADAETGELDSSGQDGIHADASR